MKTNDILNEEKFQEVYNEHDNAPAEARSYIRGQLDFALELRLITKGRYDQLWSLNDNLWEVNKYSSPHYDI